MTKYPKKPPGEREKEILKDLSPDQSEDCGLWMTHDPAIYQDTDSGWYYIYCTGAVARRSRDLIHWEKIKTKLSYVP